MSGLDRLAARLGSGELTITRLVDGSGVILDVNGLKVYSLNETGMFLVERLQGSVTDAGDLVRALVDHFEVDETTARRDVAVFLDEISRRLG